MTRVPCLNLADEASRYMVLLEKRPDLASKAHTRSAEVETRTPRILNLPALPEDRSDFSEMRLLPSPLYTQLLVGDEGKVFLKLGDQTDLMRIP